MLYTTLGYTNVLTPSKSCCFHNILPYPIIIIIIIIVIIITANELSPGSSSHTSTNKTNKNKYTQTKQIQKHSTNNTKRSKYNHTITKTTHTLQHTHEHTHLFTPWCRVLLQKLTGLQLVKKFPAFHGTRRFITALTSLRHLSLPWASPIQSI